MSEEPPTKSRKRVRQACEPCRRKKGRCSGEKPVCALCSRLGQACTWADSIDDNFAFDVPQSSVSANDHDVTHTTDALSTSEQRIYFLEEKLDEVLNHVRSLAGVPGTPNAEVKFPESNVSGNVELPDSQTLRKAASLYLKYCHNQPLPLFVPRQFETRLLSLESEVRLCVCVAALRFETDFLTAYSEEASSYIETARGLVLKKIITGRVELSTIQSLCLISLADWNNGNAQRASTNLAIATDMARNSRLDLYAYASKQSTKYEEHVRCLWSIVMLQYLCGAVGTFMTSINTSGLVYPSSSSSNSLASNAQQLCTVAGDAPDLGVVAYAAQMTEVWYRVRQYVQHRGREDSHPPWSGHSTYSKIMFSQMELESQMPHKHRFKPSGFTEHDISVLSTNRQYWAPWLYLQLAYHAIVCTLNHPLLLSLHLRRFRVKQVPELFLQHIQDMLTTHTDWVIHLLEIATEKQFESSDPFLAQFVAIVGTIFLQQSFTADEQIRAEKKAKYRQCLHFVQNLGGYWLGALEKADDLQRFEGIVTQAFSSSSAQSEKDLKSYIDLTLFWKIIDNTTAATLTSKSNSIFGSTLRLQPQSADQEAEMLSTQLLPEPTRVRSLPYPSHSAGSTPASINGNNLGMASHALVESADTPFLAQNFFSIGQDFVGNADDWFNWNAPQIMNGQGNMF